MVVYRGSCWADGVGVTSASHAHATRRFDRNASSQGSTFRCPVPNSSHDFESLKCDLQNVEVSSIQANSVNTVGSTVMEISTTPRSSPAQSDEESISPRENNGCAQDEVSERIPTSEQASAHKRPHEAMDEQRQGPPQTRQRQTPPTTPDANQQKPQKTQPAFTSKAPASTGAMLPPSVPASQFVPGSSIPTSGQKSVSFTDKPTLQGEQHAMQSIEQRRQAQVNNHCEGALHGEYSGPARGEIDEYEDENEETDEHENEEEVDQNEDEEEDDDDSPDTPLAAFDWSDLETRYQAMITQKVTEETEVWNEFCRITDVSSLFLLVLHLRYLTQIQFFGAWCSATSRHETNRGLKRHKTQAYYVRREEQRFEERRAHCKFQKHELRILILQDRLLTFSSDVKVVEAFRSALSMLEG